MNYEKMDEERILEEQILQEISRLTKLREEILAEIISLDEQIQKAYEEVEQ